MYLKKETMDKDNDVATVRLDRVDDIVRVRSIGIPKNKCSREQSYVISMTSFIKLFRQKHRQEQLH